MGDIVMGGIDVVGDEVEGPIVLGRHAGGGHHHQRKVPAPTWMRNATPQGVSTPQEELDFLPFDPFVTTAALTGFLLGRPQRPMRLERLILGAVSSAPADVSAFVVIDPAIYVGAVQVGGAQGATPITTFAANAFGVRLSAPSAGQGTDVKIFVRLLTASIIPAEGGSVTVTGTWIGRAVR